MNNYTLLHCHTEMSNAFTTLDSVNSYKQYIDKAKELNMKAIAFSEHGNIMEWFHKKEYAEKNGLKYIHGVEAYVTETLDEKIYDNYHVVLLARNKSGFYEINRLMSKATIRENKFIYDDLGNKVHYYYEPRITYDDLKKTSDNIIILTACLGGILHSAPQKMQEDFIQFLSANKNRCFLEIQHHNVKDQIDYNNKLIYLSKKYGIELVAGTDTHALNEDYIEGRKILQKSKNIHFKNEDNWDLMFKSYDELILAYQKQATIEDVIYLRAIENTNKIADMVEEFELDFSFKYPKLHQNPKQALYGVIKDGVEWRNYELTDEAKKRIRYEIAVYEKNHAIDFILLDYEVKKWCRENSIEYGESRGSVSGSLIAYLIGITHVDPLKYNLVFERFINDSRVTLADIDSDYSPNDIDKIKEYLFNKQGLCCAEIITYNTIALKGAIRDVGRALDMPLKEVDEISKNIEYKENEYREKYPELFKYVDILNGVVVSIGSHPAAICVADTQLSKDVGIFYTKDNPYPITQINMKEIESLNFLKLDVLKLDTVGIINDTCKLASIPRIRDNVLDYNDKNVWNSIHESSAMIFQWESDLGLSYYRKLFSEENLRRLQDRFGSVDYLNLLSIGNAAIRPAGESYRDDLAKGIELDYGHEALNDFLKPTFSRLVYQEQIIEFLNRFCGFTMGEADMVRRGLAKKVGTEQFLPKIESGFIKTMREHHSVDESTSKELIKSFLEVIKSASDYGFSLNHSIAYSIIGFQTAYLRYYYPLEFITTALNYATGKEEKTAEIIKYANLKGIEIKPIKFRHSKSKYMFDRSSKTIYKGIGSIKYLSSQLGDELWQLRDNHYPTFTDLLHDIKAKTSCNTRQLEILIRLDFFSEFGEANQLLKTAELYEWTNRKQISKNTIDKTPFTMEQLEKYSATQTEKMFKDIDFRSMIDEIVSTIEPEPIPIQEKAQYQQDYLGYIDLQLGVDGRNCYVTNVDTKYTPRIDVISLNKGKQLTFKINKKYYSLINIKKGDLIFIHDVNKRNKYKPDGKHKNGKMKFKKVENEFDYYIVNCEKINEDQLYYNRNEECYAR